MASPPPSREPGSAPWHPDGDTSSVRSPSDSQRELDEARLAIRRLTRELAKERARHAETSEAYHKTVSNMVSIARENALLEHEVTRLKRHARDLSNPTLTLLGLDLTPDEAAAIRRAMARLHHPDVGGDERRMKAWNAALDRFDEGK